MYSSQEFFRGIFTFRSYTLKLKANRWRQIVQTYIGCSESTWPVRRSLEESTSTQKWERPLLESPPPAHNSFGCRQACSTISRLRRKELQHFTEHITPDWNVKVELVQSHGILQQRNATFVPYTPFQRIPEVYYTLFDRPLVPIVANIRENQFTSKKWRVLYPMKMWVQ